MSDYSTVLAGMTEAFGTVSGIKVVLEYEPSVVAKTPLLYTIFRGYEKSEQGTRKAVHYRMLHRLCIARADEEASESALKPFVDSVPAAIEANPRLNDGTNDRIPSGHAAIVSSSGRYINIAGQIFRCIDFESDVLVKGVISR